MGFGIQRHKYEGEEEIYTVIGVDEENFAVLENESDFSTFRVKGMNIVSKDRVVKIGDKIRGKKIARTKKYTFDDRNFQYGKTKENTQYYNITGEKRYDESIRNGTRKKTLRDNPTLMLIIIITAIIAFFVYKRLS